MFLGWEHAGLPRTPLIGAAQETGKTLRTVLHELGAAILYRIYPIDVPVPP
jgi:hypothetical protein